jgi:hypothetical protein
MAPDAAPRCIFRLKGAVFNQSVSVQRLGALNTTPMKGGAAVFEETQSSSGYYPTHVLKRAVLETLCTER